MTPQLTTPGRHSPGEAVGQRFLLTAPLARGGMAEVWRAVEPATGREVTVKFLAPELADDAVARARCALEGANLGRVHSPHVPRLLAVGEGWIASEYVDGVDLATALAQRGTLPPDAVARLLAGAAAGLAAAHAAGVVHRDVKPSNILLAPAGAVVTDFGTSRGRERQRLTRSGNVMGTAEYLAPEVVCGETASAAVDVYALAMCAFEALTGAPPFRAHNPVATAIAHVDGVLPPLPPAVPLPLADLVRAMAARSAEQRPPMEAVALRAAALAADPFSPSPDATDTLIRGGRASARHFKEDPW